MTKCKWCHQKIRHVPLEPLASWVSVSRNMLFTDCKDPGNNERTGHEPEEPLVTMVREARDG